MNRVDVVELVVDLVDVDLDVDLVDVDLDEVDFDVTLPVTESRVKSVLDFLVLKNA